MPSQCPQCQAENIYEYNNLWTCPDCSFEWVENTQAPLESPPLESKTEIKDSNGQILQAGDSVIVIKDLKIKGSSSTVKGGTKIRNIKLMDTGDGHNISCKIESLGNINLKSEFVRKA